MPATARSRPRRSAFWWRMTIGMAPYRRQDHIPRSTTLEVPSQPRRLRSGLPPSSEGRISHGVLKTMRHAAPSPALLAISVKV